MEPTDNLTPREKAIWDKLVAIYDAADDEDKAQARNLIERAKTGKRDIAIVTIRPGTAAILFFDHNKQNREWQSSDTESYAADIQNGEWAFTNESLGFLDSGNVGDGQHRLGGVALAGRAVEITVVFGMTLESILAINSGRRRDAAQFLDITNQAEDNKRKQAMVKQAYATLRRLAGRDEEKARPFVIRSGVAGNRDVFKAISTHGHLLKEAIEIGDDSVHGRSKPTFKAREAASYVFLLLLKGWPKAKLIADLDAFQSGEDREGANSPLFVAADQLQKDAQRREGATVTARFAAAIKAFVLHEQGVKAVRVSEIRNAMKANTGVDASFPGTAQSHERAA